MTAPTLPAFRKYKYRQTRKDHPLRMNRHIPFAEKVSGPPPAQVDHRKWFPGNRNQGNEGCCTGFAVTEVYETNYGIKTGNLIPARRSPAFCYAYTRIAEGTFPRDAGATMADEFVVVQTRGVCREELMPYDQDPAEAPTPEADADAAGWKFGTPAWVDYTQPLNLKATLAAGLTVGFAMPVYTSFEGGGQGGVLAMPDLSREAVLGGHGLSLMGYDDAKQLWIVMNHWGAGWGDGGACYLPYGYEKLWWESWTAPVLP